MVVLFHYLSILNLFDGFITFYGLQNSLIEEINPLMSGLYAIHPILFLFTKVALSAFLYLLIYLKRVPYSKLTKGLTLFASSVYSGVFLLHCYWLLLGI